MAQTSDLTLRSTLTTQALATMGVDPAWDAKVANYLACSSLSRADVEWGPNARAEEVRALRRYELKAKYGKDYAKNSDAKREAEAMQRASEADADVLSERRYRPMWRAACELAATPAPTIAAAVFKSLLIEIDECWNDSEMRGDCFDIVESDFARLVGGA